MEPEQPQDSVVPTNEGQPPVSLGPQSAPEMPAAPVSSPVTPADSGPVVTPAAEPVITPSAGPAVASAASAEPVAASPEPAPTTSVEQPAAPAQPGVIAPSQPGLITPLATSPGTEAPAALAGSGQPSSKGGRTKLLLVGALAAVLLALGGAGFVFGYYIPNQPENVWKTGMTRTADEIDAFVEKLGDPAVLETLTKNKLTITGKYESDEGTIDVNVDSKFDKKSTDNTIGFKATGEALGQDIQIDADFKTQIVDDSAWPNVYLKVSGFSDLGLDSFLPGINDFDGKWISMEQDFYKQFLDETDDAGSEDEADSPLNLTQDDIASVARDIAEVTNEYVFTNDESKAILQMKEFIGTEDSEGLQANHYKVGLNKERAVSYCKALVDKIYANEVVRRLENVTDENQSEKIESEKKTCDEAEDDNSTAVPFHEDFDIWIDKKYKILHKIRLTEDIEAQNKKIQEQKADCEERYSSFDSSGMSSFCDYYDDQVETGERYIELGQIYNGTDEVRLFMQGKSDTNSQKYEYRGDISVQIETLIINGHISYTDKSEDSKGTVSVDIKTEPYDGEIDSSKPDGATPIMDVYEYLQQKSMESSLQSYYGGESLGVNTDEGSDAPEPSSLFRRLSL